MGDFAVEGSELKKMVKLAKKDPVSFAFNPGKSEEEGYCGMHRNKPPAQLGKEAKDSAEGGKFTFGTASVEGKEIRLTCLRELPGMAKRFKKFLKSQKVMLNVVILDENGNVLDSDIEDDLPDDPELDGEEQEAEEIPEAPPPIDPSALMQRLTALRGQITALSPEAQGKVAGPFKQVVDLVKAGDLERATVGADRLEQAIKLLASQPDQAPAQATSQTPPQAPPQQPQPQAPQAQDDQQLQKLTELASGTRERIEARPNDAARTQLLAAMDKVDGHIKAREAEAAIALLKRVGDILKTLPDPAAQPQQAPDGQADPAKAEWESRFYAMQPVIDRALSEGLIEKVDDLRKLRDWTTGMAMQGAHDKALQALPRIEALLETISEDGPTAFEQEIPPEVKPFATARLRWSGARATMMSEVGKLVALIQAEAAQDDMLADAAANLGVLTRNVARLDARLEDKLDAIVNAPGNDRERLKGEARALIGEYEKELSTPFFNEIDGGNGFGSVAVASTARAALADIGRVLA
jgi:ribosomal protein S20